MPEKKSTREILILAFPLVLSMSGVMIMQFIDGLFLSWYSPDAIAAVGPAGMMSFLFIVAFQGTADYTSNLVAHYVGAGRPESGARAVWQGVYFALASGIVVVFLAIVARPLFAAIGHAPSVQRMEVVFFHIMCWGAPAALVGSALSGYFTGRGDTRTLMLVQIAGFVLNGVLDWLLIFGRGPIPELGIVGAGIATVSAQLFIAAVLAVLFLRNKERRSAKAFDREMMRRLMRFGFPSGIRFTVEMLAWTAFVLFVGRIGTAELAATNIAFRINGIAFLPVIGLSRAVGILVGQAQGAKRPLLAERVTWQGIGLGCAWMAIAIALFLGLPKELYAAFRTQDAAAAPSFDAIAKVGVPMLRFVAVYSLADACNIIMMGSLQAAGDTRWTLVVSLILHVGVLVGLVILDALHAGVFVIWSAATAFIIAQAAIWIARFVARRWHAIRVIEEA